MLSYTTLFMNMTLPLLCYIPIVHYHQHVARNTLMIVCCLSRAQLATLLPESRNRVYFEATFGCHIRKPPPDNKLMNKLFVRSLDAHDSWSSYTNSNHACLHNMKIKLYRDRDARNKAIASSLSVQLQQQFKQLRKQQQQRFPYFNTNRILQ